MNASSQSDVESLRRWWKPLSNDVPKSVRGLWFGLTDLVIDGRVQRHMYVAGCPSFDASDPQAEWASQYCWWPEGRYISVPSIALGADDDYAEVLERAASLVGALGPLTVPGVQGAAVGFDDGDFINI